ncbi:MAG: conserved membrane protein of unknown function [Nitrospira sp.]|nr:MAG: conserved membrane protein of unknown function [Nitrospira sp.]
MKLPRKQAAVVRDVIEQWKQDGVIPEAQAATLAATIDVQYFDWRKLAKYSFWIALFSIVSSVSAALSDRWLRGLLQQLFNLPPIARCAMLAAASAGLYRWGLARHEQAPEKIYRNEAIFFLGMLATAGAIAQLGVLFDTGSGHFSILLLLSFLVYAVLGLWLESNLIWVFSLASLGGWMGTETGYLSGWGAYYLGMNYPLRFVLFGGLLTACALSLETHLLGQRFFRSTLATGLLYLFIALWIMSIFGNYGDLPAWGRVKQIELFHWSLLFAAVAGWAIYYGLRYDNDMTKGFGLTFLGINLYTRYFELFWNSLHKAVFFAVLAMSFWYIGSKAETIWNLGKRDYGS